MYRKFVGLTVVVSGLCLGAQPMCGGSGSGGQSNENNNHHEEPPLNDNVGNDNLNDTPEPPPPADDPPPDNNDPPEEPPPPPPANDNESEPPPANENNNEGWEEPPLETFSCDDFAPLPLEDSPPEVFVRPLVPGEATYLWLPSTWGCNNMTGEDDPEGPPDCTHLLLGTGGIGLDDYETVVRFNVDSLPEADKVETVSLELHILKGEGFYSSYIYVSRLDEPWWIPCPTNPDDWRPVCDEPNGISYGSSTYGGGNDWLWVDITELYQDWRQGVAPNYGLVLSGGLFDWYVFASADYPDESLRPRVVITTLEKKATLRFPLDGTYSPDRINFRGEGGDFGDWWEDKRCDDSDPKSSRLRHTGIDLHAEVGDPVYAVTNGEVRYAQSDTTWGGYVVLEHDGEWTSTYTHVIPIISEFTNGEATMVARGDLIATVAPISGAHLHLQVRFRFYEEPWSRRGRLPENDCFVIEKKMDEPGFPEHFIDPKCLNWEQ